jgi:sugar lactone lactonase YvrE
VTDSATGRILEISQAGNVKVWLEDPMLAGDKSACGGTGAPFAIGANGIVSDANSRYVAVTDFGRIVRIPIQANGMAGTPVVHIESCADLQGADGIALEAAGSIVVVRNGPSLTMSRISADGRQVTPIHVGAPLDGPASVVLEGGATPRLVLTNSAFFSGDSGKPSVLALPL